MYFLTLDIIVFIYVARGRIHIGHPWHKRMYRWIFSRLLARISIYTCIIVFFIIINLIAEVVCRYASRKYLGCESKFHSRLLRKSEKIKSIELSTIIYYTTSYPYREHIKSVRLLPYARVAKIDSGETRIKSATPGIHTYLYT